MGICIPEQLSVIGVNNIELSERVYPRLTTVELPAIRQGEAAGELLIALMKGKSATDSILSPRLIRRESSGTVRLTGKLKMEKKK